MPRGAPMSIGPESMYNEDEDAKQSLLREDNVFNYSPNITSIDHLIDSVDDSKN